MVTLNIKFSVVHHNNNNNHDLQVGVGSTNESLCWLSILYHLILLNIFSITG